MAGVKRVLFEECSGGQEAHEAHMELNGECPWCSAVGESDPSLDGLSPEDAVAEVVRRHG
jgi:hypothetical protein